ncbi:TetR-like C-terminal domain-containing protein [Streptomyces sp. NPDC058251]|uniref:TetR-like C-terminal domain-containing protein n=1 Tax=Streptomyces sp. NPDC058251 TaxID=3346404 RepID=UPI0036E06B92
MPSPPTWSKRASTPSGEGVVGALAMPGTAVPERPAAQFREWMKHHGIEDVSEAVAARTTMLWAHLHGLVGLEIEGHVGSMGIDPAALYETELEGFVRSL